MKQRKGEENKSNIDKQKDVKEGEEKVRLNIGGRI
jgi:hypothetical protein